MAEYPSQSCTGTRDSFERGICPVQFQLFIYEYERNDWTYVQVSWPSGGNGVNYRFIGKPFELVDYLFKNNAANMSSVSMNWTSA